jgi:hypothetical protein
MKTNRLLRVVSLLGVLLIFAPFYDSCAGHYLHKINTSKGKEIVSEKPFTQKVYDIVVDDEAFNAFQISSLSIYAIKESTFTEIKNDVAKSVVKKGWYKDIGILISFFFDVVILLSFSLFLLSFTKRNTVFKKMALVNLVLIILTLCYIIFLENSFHQFAQIKWGYYAFILNSGFLYYYAAKLFPTQAMGGQSEAKP